MTAAVSRKRRWLKRIGLGFCGLLVLGTGLGTGYEMLGRWQAARQYPPPGKLVDIGGRRMHIDCRGTGTPTVVFEAGLDWSGTLSWSKVHDSVASFTRACAYDRAGVMWSDPKSGGQDANAVADDLHATLKAAGITGPLVLTGHSIGGPYVVTYTGKYPAQVAGLVLVDASHPDQFARFATVTKVDLHPRSILPIAKVASALSWMGIVRLAAGYAQPPNSPQDAAETMAAFASKSIAENIAEVEGYDRSMAQAGAIRDLGNRPLVILSALAPQPPETLKALGMTRQQGARFRQIWQALHAEEASWSTRGRQQSVPDAHHYIQYDRPDAVIAAVKQVVDMVRADQSFTAAGVARKEMASRL